MININFFIYSDDNVLLKKTKGPVREPSYETETCPDNLI